METLDPRFERTRSRVREASIGILIEEGAHALTHQRVAERAGIGRATIYRHWEDRWALMREALEAMSLSITPRPGASTESNLVYMLETLCDQLSSPAAAALISLVAEAEVDDQARELRARLVGNAVHVMGAVVAGDASIRPGIGLEGLAVRVSELAGPYFFERFFLGRIESRAAIPQRVGLFLAGLSEAERSEHGNGKGSQP